MPACKICYKTSDISMLEFEATEDCESYKLPVCGTCWDIIANITEKVVMSILDEQTRRNKPWEQDEY